MEGFFLVSGSFDSVELRELLLRRYHSLAFVDDMDIFEFLDFCIMAREKEQDERLYMQFCALLPNLKKEYMSYDKFKAQMTGANIDTRPIDEIIAEIDAAHEKAGIKDGTGDI